MLLLAFAASAQYHLLLKGGHVIERAVEAGNLANLPVMVDFGSFTDKRPFQDLVLKKLRPGDI